MDPYFLVWKHIDGSSLCGFIYSKNFNDSNIDGSFTMADSNSFLSAWKILPIAQENKYLCVCVGGGGYLYFAKKKKKKTHVVHAHKNRNILQ